MTHEQKVILGIVDGPKWPDHCNHPAGTYVCTFEWYDHKRQTEEVLDMYVFPGNYGGDHVCLRHDVGDGDYYSPGPLTNVIEIGQFDPYRRAYDILKALGVFRWQRTET